MLETSVLQLIGKHGIGGTDLPSPLPTRHNEISHPKTKMKESYIFLSSSSNQFQMENLKTL